jgi:hypothetical protein
MMGGERLNCRFWGAGLVDGILIWGGDWGALAERGGSSGGRGWDCRFGEPKDMFSNVWATSRRGDGTGWGWWPWRFNEETEDALERIWFVVVSCSGPDSAPPVLDGEL